MGKLAQQVEEAINQQTRQVCGAIKKTANNLRLAVHNKNNHSNIIRFQLVTNEQSAVGEEETAAFIRLLSINIFASITKGKVSVYHEVNNEAHWVKIVLEPYLPNQSSLSFRVLLALEMLFKKIALVSKS